MYRLYNFSTENGEREFVVISNLSPEGVKAKWAVGGIFFDEIVELYGDAVHFPCDRELKAV